MKTFEILPYPSRINFSVEERRLLSIEARVYDLTDLDKRKVRCCIEVAVLTDGLAVFPAGFSCTSLKKYIDELGHKYTSCGNGFDLWVNV